MCKRRYLYELEREMGKVGTFVDANESQDDILKRHKEFHLERMLEANDRLCYPYGIWKSAKRKMRWISGVKRNEKVKGMEQEEEMDVEGDGEGKPQGSLAGVGKELVGVIECSDEGFEGEG